MVISCSAIFRAYAYDAYVCVNAAIPVALKKTKPGSPEFRTALREALESLKRTLQAAAPSTA